MVPKEDKFSIEIQSYLKEPDTMLPSIVAFASIVTLLASLYKERKLAPGTTEVKRALRIHHLAQSLIIVLALWAAIDTSNSNRQYKAALLDSEAALAAAHHTTAIVDTYIMKLLPAATAIRNYERYQASLSHIPPAMREKLDWRHHVTHDVEEERRAGLDSFERLQSIAREILNERLLYGERYPDTLTRWAERTLDVRKTDLAELLSDSETGHAYAQLTGQATGAAIANYRISVNRRE